MIQIHVFGETKHSFQPTSTHLGLDPRHVRHLRLLPDDLLERGDDVREDPPVRPDRSQDVLPDARDERVALGDDGVHDPVERRDEGRVRPRVPELVELAHGEYSPGVAPRLSQQRALGFGEKKSTT